jgi:hypothetical protein
MKTAMYYLLEEARKYQKESGNDAISIDLLEQGINGIYGNMEKDQIKRAFNVGGTEAYEMSSDDYYNETFETNKETLK